MNAARFFFLKPDEHFVHRSVDCFVVGFERLRVICGDLHELLSDDEHDRLAGYRHERDREHYGLSHAFLRIMLASYAAEANAERQDLRCNAKHLKFANDALGKPLCTGKSPMPAFSLSRSQNAVAVGVDWNGPVGVDVESESQAEHMTPSLYAYAFSVREQDYITSSRSPKEDALKLWTRKEALVKACGFGLRLPINEVETLPTSDQPLALPRGIGPASNWQLFTKVAASEVFSLALRR